MINNSWQGAASSNWNYNLDNRHWFSPERSSHTGHSVKRLCIASIYPAFSALKFQSRSLRRGILNPTLDHFKYKITQTWKVFKSNGRLSMAALVCHRSDYKNKPHWSRDNRNINQKKTSFHQAFIDLHLFLAYLTIISTMRYTHLRVGNLPEESPPWHPSSGEFSWLRQKMTAILRVKQDWNSYMRIIWREISLTSNTSLRRRSTRDMRWRNFIIIIIIITIIIIIVKPEE